MNKLILVAGAALIAASFLINSQTTAPVVVDDYATQFAEFKQTYNKKYAGAEDAYRFAVFTANVMQYQLHNANPEATWEMGVTQFSDLTQEEFAATYLTLKHSDLPQEYSIYEDDGCTYVSYIFSRPQWSH
jgi:hypothetical protein